MKASQHVAYPLEQRRVTKMSERLEALVQSGQSRETWKTILTERDPAKQALARQSKKLAENLLDDDAVSNPVRARFDIRHADTAQDETYYIGTKDVEMPDEGVRVLDWRAPITSVFYDADCGAASYVGPDDLPYDVMLLLRRALQIEQRRLAEIMDLDVLDGYTPDGNKVLGTLQADEFLLGILNSPAGNTLREIIGTIQREQHQIIREPRDRPLVLQAVAGSGKSTIALHRLAQILYDLRRRQIQAGKVAVFGPNPILVKYISRLLPSLQEHEVAHQTFTEWALSVMYPKRKKSGDEMGAKPTVVQLEALEERRRGPAAAKGSFEFMEALERYLSLTVERKLPRDDVRIGPSITCPRDSVWQWYQGAADLPYAKRLEFTASQLENWARDEAAKLADQLEATAKELQTAVHRSFPAGAVQKRYKDEADKLLRHIRRDLMQAVSTAVQEITSRWQLGNLRELYLALICQAGTLAEVLHWPAERIQQFCRANGGVRRQRWDEGDVGAMMYMFTRVHGVSPDARWAHVVVDEGQDWSPVCYAVLRSWVLDESVTIVGDLAQGISGGAGLQDWEELRGRVFGENTLQVREISRSYRLTRQILDLGLAVLRNGGLSVGPGLDAIRLGLAPDVRKLEGQEHEENVVLEFARQHVGEKWSVAVVTPDAESAEEWQSVLRRGGVPVSLIGKSEVFEGRVTVAPVLLSKGLEFDYVAVVGAGPRIYPVGRESAKRLYVAITRAKQHVLVTSQRKLSPLLPGGEAEDPIELKGGLTQARKRTKAPAADEQAKKSVKRSPVSSGRRRRTGNETAGTSTRKPDRAQSMEEIIINQMRGAVRKDGPTQTSPPRPSIVEFLKSTGAEVVDMRPNGGALWIVGGKEMSPLVSQLQTSGWQFRYMPGGGRATGNRDAWFTKQKDSP